MYVNVVVEIKTTYTQRCPCVVIVSLRVSLVLNNFLHVQNNDSLCAKRNTTKLQDCHQYFTTTHVIKKDDLEHASIGPDMSIKHLIQKEFDSLSSHVVYIDNGIYSFFITIICPQSSGANFFNPFKSTLGQKIPYSLIFEEINPLQLYLHFQMPILENNVLFFNENQFYPLFVHTYVCLYI